MRPLGLGRSPEPPSLWGSFTVTTILGVGLWAGVEVVVTVSGPLGGVGGTAQTLAALGWLLCGTQVGVMPPC